MNVIQAALVFISFVAANGTFPAVMFGGRYSLAIPRLLPLSDTEVKVGFKSFFDASYFACPLDQHQREEDAIPEVLLQHDIVTKVEIIYLDNLPQCELQPKVSSELIDNAEHSTYSIGYKVYHERTEDDHASSRLYSSRDKHAVGKVFTLNFNTATKKTISVEHELCHLRFIATASNKKHTFVYEKNEDLLKIDLDHLYQNFVDQILPRMMEEKLKNKLAHALGIQKVQLVTPDDFVLDTWKVATYWNINTVPIWRVLLQRWNAIEIYIRKVYKRAIDIKVETGVSGTLEFAEPYYENNTMHKLDVPKYVWKLMTPFLSKDKAMLIVMHNDPFTERQERLCEDICAINGWLVSNNDYRTGLVYCCEMTEDIVQILEYSKDTNEYGIYSFTKDEDGTENLNYVSSILSDPPKNLYDW